MTTGAPQRDIELVQQKHSHGCGHAVLAMLTGESYDAVVAHFNGEDPAKNGLASCQIDQYLFNRGYSIRRMWVFQKRRINDEQVKTTPWPPEPFAPAHFANVTVFENAPVSHWVIVKPDGIVLDPLSPEPKRLSDYYAVNNVTGVYRWRWRRRRSR